MILKYWYWFSLLLLIYNLDTLNDESNIVHYNRIREKRKNDLFEATMCFPLDSVLQLTPKERRKQIDGRQMMQVSELIEVATESLNNEFQIKLDKLHSYFANNHCCFAVKSEHLKATNNFDAIDFKLFPFSPDARPLFFEQVFAHKKNKVNFHELILETTELHYKSNKYWRCKHDPRLENGMKDTLGNCLNYCLRKGAPKAIYLYEITENVLVNLSDNQRDFALEKKCNASCQTANCLIMNHNAFDHRLRDNESAELIVNPLKYVGYYFIDGLDYGLQFVGIIGLFLNVSFIQLMPPLLKVAARAVIQQFKIGSISFDKLVKWLRLLMYVFSVVILCFLSYLIGAAFYQELRYPITYHFFEFTPKSLQVSIVLCVPVQSLIYNETSEFNQSTENAMLETNSFETIEKLTDDGLGRVLKRIYLFYESREKQLDYMVSKLVLFANSTYELDRNESLESTSINLLERCFRLDLQLNETVYEQYLLMTEVVVKIRNGSKVKIYLVKKEEHFLSNSFEFTGNSQLTIFNERQSEDALGSNCAYYAERPDLNCDSQSHCIERCIVSSFLARHSSITTRAVAEKNELAMIRQDFNRLHFNQTADWTIEEECKEKYDQTNCEFDKFMDFYRYGHQDPNEYKINLNSFLIHNNQQKASYQKLVLKFLNILSIIYGVSIKKMLNFALSFRNFRWRYPKLCKHFVRLLTLTGFAGYVFLIFFQVINGEFAATGSFTKTDELPLPTIVFCLNVLDILPSYHEMADNHVLTGALLEEQTSNFTIDNILSKLVYLNGKNEFIEASPSDKETRELFEFQTFQQFNLKCWQITAKLVYNESDFFTLEDPYPIKFYLNRSALPEFFYFAWKIRDSKVLSDIVKLRSSERVNRKARLERFEQEYIDKFRFIRHLLAWLYERFYGLVEVRNRSSYLDRLKNDFSRKFNLTTRLVFLEQQHFHLELSDQLFHQYYSQVQRQVDANAMPQLFSKFSTFLCMFIDQSMDEPDEPDFEIFNTFFIFNTMITMEDNLIHFTQDFLNGLSFFLSICILDLHICLLWSFHFIASFYLGLQRAKSYFESNLSV